MVLSIYKWDQQWLRRAAYPNRYGLPGWALSSECCCTCMLFQDEFNRPDSANLGSDWNEVTGDWGILDEQLVEDYSTGTDGTADAVLLCTQPVPLRSLGEMYIDIDVPIANLAVGDVFKIFPCCPTTSSIGDVTATFTYLGNDYPDGKGYWQIELTPSSGDESTDIIASQAVEETICQTLKVCADHETKMVRAGISPAVNELSAWTDEDPGDGRYAGIGHDNTTHLTKLDSFEMGELRTATKLCHKCLCPCDPVIPMPPVLTGQFLYTDEDSERQRALCLEGISWTMNYTSGPTIVHWIGSVTIGSETIEFTLVCGDGGLFTLNVTAPNTCITLIPQNNRISAPHASTCDPIALVFGPYTLDFAMDCSLCYPQYTPGDCMIPVPPPTSKTCFGDYYIVFTE